MNWVHDTKKYRLPLKSMNLVIYRDISWLMIVWCLGNVWRGTWCMVIVSCVWSETSWLVLKTRVLVLLSKSIFIGEILIDKTRNNTHKLIFHPIHIGGFLQNGILDPLWRETCWRFTSANKYLYFLKFLEF